MVTYINYLPHAKHTLIYFSENQLRRGFINWETEAAGGSEQHEHPTASSGTVRALKLWSLCLQAHKVATCPIVLHRVTQK